MKSTPAAPKQPKRRAIPLKAKVDALLLMLGLDPEAVDWDHQPPLAIREIDHEAGEWVPHQHDPRFLTPMSRGAHGAKTNGTAATTAGSDKHMIAKAKRLERERLERERLEAQRRLLGRSKTETKAKADAPKHRWGKRKFPQRTMKQ